MKRLRLIGLGARLATAGGRSAWIRLGLMAAGFAVGSEGLVSAWGEIGPSIERRLHGHLAGTIGHEGVLGPDELSIWEGKPADVHLRLSDAYVQGSFRVQGHQGVPLPLEALLAVMVAASVTMVPI